VIDVLMVAAKCAANVANSQWLGFLDRPHDSSTLSLMPRDRTRSCFPDPDILQRSIQIQAPDVLGQRPHPCPHRRLRIAVRVTACGYGDGLIPEV
jgi:hypothetical protein